MQNHHMSSSSSMSFLTASRTGSYASRESTRPSFPSIMASENCLAISQQDLGEQVVILLTANGSEVSDIPSAIGEWCRIRSHGSFTPTVPFTGFAGFFFKVFFCHTKTDLAVFAARFRQCLLHGRLHSSMLIRVASHFRQHH